MSSSDSTGSSEMQRLILRTRMHAGHLRSSTRSLSHFTVVEHVVPCSHSRQYIGGVEPGRETDLKLAVKQYTPRHQNESSTGRHAVTLIGAHANAFPKELYEPMWDDLYERLQAKGTAIRSIWVADIASQNQSGILNEDLLGDDPSWWDHSRDLLFLINQKQGEMPQPLIGVGHSVGAAQLAALSLIHPRLLQALVLIEPVIQTENPSMSFAPPSTYRRDMWPSREEANAAFRKSKFYQQWDERVLEKWLEHGLRELPTPLYPDTSKAEDGKTPMTLTTTKAQENLMYLRPLYKRDARSDKELYADYHPDRFQDHDRFYRPEPNEIFRRLPELYPPTRYIFGATSIVSTPELRRKKMETTGAGVGGNGGVDAGQVYETVLECGHLASFEKTKECATVAADFISEQLDRWTKRRQTYEKAWQSKPRRERMDLDDEWKTNIGPPPERPKKTAPPSTPAT